MKFHIRFQKLSYDDCRYYIYINGYPTTIFVKDDARHYCSVHIKNDDIYTFSKVYSKNSIKFVLLDYVKKNHYRYINN